MRKIFLLLICACIISSCNIASSVTAIPAMTLGFFEKKGKRDKWEEYAKKGDVYSQYELAESYCCKPDEGSVKPEKALNWFCTAARNGYAKAQLKIGKLYENADVIEGIFIPRNELLAYTWYSLAARRQNTEAVGRRNGLEPRMSLQQKREVQRILNTPKMVPCGDDRPTK